MRGLSTCTTNGNADDVSDSCDARCDNGGVKGDVGGLAENRVRAIVGKVLRDGGVSMEHTLLTIIRSNVREC